MQRVENIDAAYMEVSRHMRENGHKILSTTETNFGRYVVMKTDKKCFLVMYKRELFRNFAKMFRDRGAKGLGESVNIDDLKTAVHVGVRDLVFIYPNGAIYSISVSDFLIKSIKWTNKENKEVRSISIHEFNFENKPGTYNLPDPEVSNKKMSKQTTLNI